MKKGRKQRRWPPIKLHFLPLTTPAPLLPVLRSRGTQFTTFLKLFFLFSSLSFWTLLLNFVAIVLIFLPQPGKILFYLLFVFFHNGLYLMIRVVGGVAIAPCCHHFLFCVFFQQEFRKSSDDNICIIFFSIFKKYGNNSFFIVTTLFFELFSYNRSIKSNGDSEDHFFSFLDVAMSYFIFCFGVFLWMEHRH